MYSSSCVSTRRYKIAMEGECQQSFAASAKVTLKSRTKNIRRWVRKMLSTSSKATEEAEEKTVGETLAVERCTKHSKEASESLRRCLFSLLPFQHSPPEPCSYLEQPFESDASIREKKRNLNWMPREFFRSLPSVQRNEKRSAVKSPFLPGLSVETVHSRGNCVRTKCAQTSKTMSSDALLCIRPMRSGDEGWFVRQSEHVTFEEARRERVKSVETQAHDGGCGTFGEAQSAVTGDDYNFVNFFLEAGIVSGLVRGKQPDSAADAVEAFVKCGSLWDSTFVHHLPAKLQTISKRLATLSLSTEEHEPMCALLNSCILGYRRYVRVLLKSHLHLITKDRREPFSKFLHGENLCEQDRVWLVLMSAAVGTSPSCLKLVLRTLKDSVTPSVLTEACWYVGGSFQERNRKRLDECLCLLKDYIPKVSRLPKRMSLLSREIRDIPSYLICARAVENQVAEAMRQG